MVLFYVIAGILVALYLLSFLLPVSGTSSLYGSAHFEEVPMSNDGDGLVIDGVRRIDLKSSLSHLACISPTGAGKTTGYILPNLLTLDDVSIICTDIKGELTELSSGHLEQKGFNVMVLDFGDTSRSMQYNPLDRCKTPSDIKHIATIIFDLANRKAETEGIWRQGAITIMEILLSCLSQTEERKYFNIANLIRLMYQIDADTPTVDRFIETFAPSEEIQITYKSFMNQEVKIRSGQLSSAHTALAPFNTDEIKHLTAISTINFESFRYEKTVLYLKIPPGDSGKYAPVISLFYSQLIDFLLKTSVSASDLPIYILADEFGNLKKIPRFAEAITLLRSQKVSLSIVLQDMLQLERIYGSYTAEVIMANCSNLLIYPGIRGEKTLKFVQTLLGRKTKESYNVNGHLQIVATPLLNLDQIRTMKHSLFISGTRYAQKIKPVPIYRNKKLMAKAFLRSENNSLVSELDPIVPDVNSSPVAYFSFDTETKEEGLMKERLMDLLHKEKDH